MVLALISEVISLRTYQDQRKLCLSADRRSELKLLYAAFCLE